MKYSLARKLHELRVKNGCISQMTLSKETGISQSSLARWELGQSEPKASEIRLLCAYYRISADELLNIAIGEETTPEANEFPAHNRRGKFEEAE